MEYNYELSTKRMYPAILSFIQYDFPAFVRSESEIPSFYETVPERMSLTKFGHALTKFDQISVMEEGRGESPYGGGYYGSTAARLLGQRMTRTKVWRWDPAEKMFREGVFS